MATATYARGPVAMEAKVSADRLPPAMELMEQAHKRIEELSGHIDRLEERLSRVLPDVPKMVAGEDSPGHPTNSSPAQRCAADLNRKIDGASSRLCDIIERITL